MSPRLSRRGWLGIGLGVVALAAFLPGWVADLRATRGAVAAYVEVIAAANAGDLRRVRGSCSSRYLDSHRLIPAEEGGVVGLPRGIHPNFQAWRDRDAVLLCPTNRVGPVYRFVREAGVWKFDGPAGVIGRDGRFFGGEEDVERSPVAGRRSSRRAGGWRTFLPGSAGASPSRDERTADALSWGMRRVWVDVPSRPPGPSRLTGPPRRLESGLR